MKFVYLIIGSLFLLGCSVAVEQESVSLSNFDDSDVEGIEITKTEESTGVVDMRIFSPDFEQGESIPTQFTCEGENINPELVFEAVPTEATGLVLIMDDPDAPRGTFDHWVQYNIPNSATGIEQDGFVGGQKGLNGRGQTGYIGPCPPDGEHRYFFTLYALSENLGLADNADKQTVLDGLEGKILAKAELMGLYEKINP